VRRSLSSYASAAMLPRREDGLRREDAYEVERPVNCLGSGGGTEATETCSRAPPKEYADELRERAIRFALALVDDLREAERQRRQQSGR
jgi:hypothetical protein